MGDFNEPLVKEDKFGSRGVSVNRSLAFKDLSAIWWIWVSLDQGTLGLINKMLAISFWKGLIGFS